MISGDSRMMVQTLVKLIIQSIQRRGELEGEFAENDQLEEEDQEVGASLMGCLVMFGRSS